MAMRAEMLKTTEAAVVSRVALRDVNRAIDEGILPDGFFTEEGGRHVLPGACMLISFYFDSARQLTAEERRHTIKLTESRLRKWCRLRQRDVAEQDWMVRHEFLTIDLHSFAKHAAEGLERLAAARELVEISPDLLGGMPVIRDTRILVYDVAASIAAGHPIERILAAYPSLDAEKIELAGVYAEANPPRGRPRAGSELPKGAIIVSDRRVPRRGSAG